MTKNLKDCAVVWQHRWSVLIHKIERVQTAADEQNLLVRLTHPKRAFVLAFANAHAMNSLTTSTVFFDALNSADMVLRDGSGMATLFKLLKIQPGFNLNGTDLIPKITRQFNGRCVALFGTQAPYLQQGLEAVKKDLAPLSALISANGFMKITAYVELAQVHQPALIVLGMGMPRQEEVAAALRSTLNYPCLIVCGGAIIDFWAGKTPRAPLWVRRVGMEWGFRLAMEPRRLFQRYVIGNPLFLMRALRFTARERY